MTPTEQANLETVRQYLQAVERGAQDEAFAFFAPDVVQEEFPNRVTPQTARRGLKEMRKGAERGRKVMAGQRYEVLNAVASGDFVALEVLWIGILKVPYGSIPEGGEMRARCGIFFELRDGKIAAQRNYDCFEPF